MYVTRQDSTGKNILDETTVQQAYYGLLQVVGELLRKVDSLEEKVARLENEGKK
jgi:hypothetical protein